MTHKAVFSLLIASLIFVNVNCDVPKSALVKCAVCRSLVTELHAAIDMVDPRKTIEVGSFHLKNDGNQNAEKRKYAGSEVHMTEMLETVCIGFKDDYVQARSKATQKLEAIKLVSDGKMNPRISDYDLIQDPDLNKGLVFHCESIVEDYEDVIVSHMQKNSAMKVTKSQDQLCNKLTDICSKVKDEL